MASGWWIGVVVAAGCGRLDFDTRNDAQPVAPMGCEFDLCDGFEAPAIDPSVWSIDGEVTRDTTVAHTGAASAHLHVDAVAAGQRGAATLSETRTLASGPAMFWVRAWMLMEGAPVATNGLELLSSEQQVTPFIGDYVFVHRADTQVYSDFDHSVAMTTTTPPQDTWFCLVWQVVPSTSSTGSLALSSDRFASIGTDAITDGASPIETVSLGPDFERVNVDVAQDPIEVWLDDVIVHSAPVTCDD